MSRGPEIPDYPDVDVDIDIDDGAADAEDSQLPGDPVAPPSPPSQPPGSKLKDFWKEITGKGKGPYQKVPQDDKKALL